MRYLPHTDEDTAAMLETVGAESLDELFAAIPGECRRSRQLHLPDALTEWELNTCMEEMADRNAQSPEYALFLGAGSYDHYIPESVQHLLSRSEFSTAYTPYQPEASQGTLQAVYEYQTLTARLTGMDIANASLYDGASALAEACLMAVRITKKRRIALSALIHPFYRQVVRTYLRPAQCEIVELPPLPSGTTDISSLASEDSFAAVAIQSPNFFGCIENPAEAEQLCRKGGALLIVSFTEPLAFGLFKSPGSQGADIVCGEGQGLGIPRSFGGPGLGIFATRSKYVRSMPGRLVGKTRDLSGRQGFVLTLATREQHIRRERATSNICTNSNLCALAAAMYLASLGGTGFRDLARLNYDKTEYLKKGLAESGFTIPFTAPTFNEFVLQCPQGFKSRYDELVAGKIVAGLPLSSFHPEFAEHYLFCVTETVSRQNMDRLIKEMSK